MRNFGFGLGFGTGTAGVESEWYDAAAYADMAAVADFNSDRYAITTVALGSVPGATAAQLKVKRAATFAEFFAFTAASTTERTYTDGSGVVKNDLAANAPRFTWANSKRQLRLENAATNAILHSADFANAAWTDSNLDLTSNAIAAPDGTTTADLWAENTVTPGFHFFRPTAQPTITSTTVATYSVHLKADIRTQAVLELRDNGTSNGGNVVFTLTGAGTVGTATNDGTGTNTSGTITALANGWYRCTVTTTFAVAQTLVRPTVLTYNGSSTSFAGTIGAGFYAWGAQVEASAFATDYIPTTTVAVPRAIETARFSPLIEAILARSAGSVVVRCDLENTSISKRMIGIDSNTMLYAHSSNDRVGSYNGSVDLTSGAGSMTNNKAAAGFAVGFDGAGRSVTGGPGTGAVGSDANTIGTRASIWLGRDSTGTGGGYAEGYYDFVGIAPERLSNAALQALAVAA